ncbi:hypothetical protein ACERK3_02950 [Phycisphaerales bacterium AB-hyl4]|uniref:Uncharacterized protein n=1 Tax=Natronomicrosphaera hydrolytica TaxID=3242702 RepID=A0ABV4U1L5_9BACT
MYCTLNSTPTADVGHTSQADVVLLTAACRGAALLPAKHRMPLTSIGYCTRLLDILFANDLQNH